VLVCYGGWIFQVGLHAATYCRVAYHGGGVNEPGGSTNSPNKIVISLRSHLPWSVRCALLCVDPSPILPLRFPLKYGSPPLCFAQQELHRQTPQHKITQESSTAVFEATKYKKMSQHHISGNVDSFNIQDSFNKVWNNCTIADEDSEILAWISPLEPQTRHYDIRTRRIDEVGEWLLQTEEYRNWFGGIRGRGGGGPNGSALFCYGGPGVGKTYIR